MWKYLNSSPFHVRQILAAHYLKGIPTIIEIGGYKSPISSFLEYDFEQALNVDPLSEGKDTDKVLHLKDDYRNIDFSPYTKRPYALVLLGAELPVTKKLLELRHGAQRLILEAASHHEDGRWALELLRPKSDFELDLKIELDLSGNNFGDPSGSYSIYSRRLLYVFSNMNPPNQG